MNKARGAKNILYGLLSEIIVFAVGIIIPRLVIVSLGSEANGLLSSVRSALTYMSLLEAGVGTASLQALYKPCANKDHDSINSIMSATSLFYRRTGIVYFAVVCVLSVCYPILLDTTLSKIDVFLVVFITGVTGVISYFFQGKFKILLDAEGLSYVKSNITTFVYTGTHIAKAVLLYLGFNIVAVEISNLVFAVIQMLVYELYKRRHFAWLNYRVKPDLKAISQKNAVLIHQINYMIFNNTDVIVLTIFAGLKSVSVYSMYVLIYGMVKSLAVKLYQGYYYSLGQAYHSDKGKFTRMINAYEQLTILVTFSLYCICRIMILPFLSLYTKGVHDISYVDPYLPWLFSAFYLLHNARTASAAVIEISQHFEETKWRAVVESAINITISLVCVNAFGIYGVLMGTIAALLYRTNDMILYASKLLGRSCWITYRRWLLNVAIFGGLSLAANQVTLPAANYFQLALSLIAVAVVVIGVFIAVNAAVERQNAKYILHILKGTLGKMLRRRGPAKPA